jgi:hypothetical protein
MARPLLIPIPENATIEELKQVSRVRSTDTATRCTAIQMLLVGASRDLACDALLVIIRALRKWINRFNRCANVIGMVCPQLLERLDQAILDVINNPQKAQKTARIGTLV